MNLKRVAVAIPGLTPMCLAGTFNVPGNSLTIPTTSTSGTSFVYSGTLTQNDTIDVSIAGTGCLQSGGFYCTNASGVVKVAGTTAVGGSSSFTGSVGGFTKTYTYGSVILVISGVGSAQIFTPTVANGSGSGNPPTTLSRATTSLAALGFSNFSVTNPTISFIMADDLYIDNSGTFSLTTTPSESPSPTPAPGTLGLLVVALGAAAVGTRIYRQRAA